MSDFGSRSGAHPSLRHPGRAARSTSGTQAPSLTDEQRLVLQAIFDHFHVHATWPTFISIGRPCVESMASIQRQPPVRSPSRSLCRPGQGTCVPRQATRSDSAYLASMSARVGWLTPGGSFGCCAGSRSKRWPTSLSPAVRQRCRDHWGPGGNGSGQDGWYITLGPDIWRFRDVHTVEDCIRVREEWVNGS